MAKPGSFEYWFYTWRDRVTYCIIVAAAAFAGTAFLTENIYRSGIFMAVAAVAGSVLIFRLTLPKKGVLHYRLWKRILYVVSAFYGFTAAPLVEDALDSRNAALIIVPCSLLIFVMIGALINVLGFMRRMGD